MFAHQRMMLAHYEERKRVSCVESCCMFGYYSSSTVDAGRIVERAREKYYVYDEYPEIMVLCYSSTICSCPISV